MVSYNILYYILMLNEMNMVLFVYEELHKILVRISAGKVTIWKTQI